VRSRGERYSSRLENLIESVNWAEGLAFDCGCSAVICGGDFFDSTELNCEEISALKEIEWAPISHVFITGNHESTVKSLEFSTTEIFNLCPNSVVMHTPQQYFIDGANGVEFCFLPYVTELDRKPLIEYFGKPTSKRIIFSHNDLKDVQYGQFISTEGFSISEIEDNCDLYLNGHIHHCSCVTEKIINGGNLTGQNFTEDAFKFEHCALIIDTDTMKVTFYKNPYALNFYKLNATHIDDECDLRLLLGTMSENSVSTIKVKASKLEMAKSVLSNLPSDKKLEYRLLVEQDTSVTTEATIETLQTDDHLKQFEQYVLSNIGNSDIIKEELLKVMG
jgi:DNA repair exonuclease SbcCD nuclease subunit